MENEVMKKNNTKPIVLSIIGVLIVLLIVVGVIYKLKVVGDPVTLTTIALEELGEKLEDESSYGKMYEFLADNDTVELNMTGNVTMPMDMGTISLDMMMQEDVDKREAIMDLDVKLDGEDAIYLEGQLDKDATYFAFKENSSKYYYLNDLKYPESSEIDVDSFLDKFIESFKESVKKDNFVESEKEIIVNGETITAKQYSLKLTNNLTKTIMDKFFAKIENDKELMGDIVALTDYTEAELKEAFDTMIADVDASEEAEVYYNLYVYRNTAIRYEIADDASTIMIDDYKNAEITIKGTDSYDEEMVMSFKENKNVWDINLTSTDFTMNGSISEDKYSLTLKADGMTIKVDGTNSYKEINDGLDTILKGNISMEQEGTTVTIPYEFNINLKEIEKVTLKNITDKVDINNMTPEQETEFNNDLMQIPLMTMLMGDMGATDYSAEADIYTDEYGYGY